MYDCCGYRVSEAMKAYRWRNVSRFREGCYDQAYVGHGAGCACCDTRIGALYE